jgi:ankyrin repeat protein
MSTPEPAQPKPGDEQLFAAVAQKDADAVRRLVQQGANLDATDDRGRTPAMVATYNNDVATAKALIEAGADVNLRDAMLNNPFLYAGAEGQLEILRLTIAAGADPTIVNRYGGTALIPAGEHGHVEVIRELLTTTSIDVNHVNNLGWTALLEAIILNNGNARQQEAIRLLIEHGADVDLADGKGVTPLQHARARGFAEIVAMLRAAGARE